jgi:hypothetical protein
MFPHANTFICVGPNCWGADNTPAKARQRMRQYLYGRKGKMQLTFIATTAPLSDIEVHEGIELSVEIPKKHAAVKWTEQVTVR